MVRPRRDLCDRTITLSRGSRSNDKPTDIENLTNEASSLSLEEKVVKEEEKICVKVEDGELKTTESRRISEAKSFHYPLVLLHIEVTRKSENGGPILLIGCCIIDKYLIRAQMGPILLVKVPSDLEYTESLTSSLKTADVFGSCSQNNQEICQFEDAERCLFDFIEKELQEKKNQVAGYEVFNMMNLLRNYMPRIHSYFSHRIIEFSTLDFLSKSWNPKRDRSDFVPNCFNNSAEDLLKESVREAQNGKAPAKLIIFKAFLKSFYRLHFYRYILLKRSNGRLL
mmetsp:Transcript_11119/g.20118  ORF Transcript_11119/g.20118 Transcript_11119/m.20118 type:complete len:283 (-) Transcript_11119:6-854(-)